MSDQMSFEGFANGTCSPASGAGPSPCESQDGQTIAKSSPRRVRVNRSAKLAAAPDSVTSGIYGPVQTPSSVTSAPKSAWESRLMDLLGTFGSTERELTWKIVDTPSGQSYFQLAVSTPRRVDIAGSGLPAEPEADAKLWSAAQAHDSAPSDPNRWRKNGTEHGAANLNDETAAVAVGKLWSTVKANSSTGAGQRGDGGINIQTEVSAISEPWPIVSARDWKSDSSIKSGQELYGTKGKPLARTALEVAQGEHWPGVRANRRGNPDSHGADPVALVTGTHPDGPSDPTAISEQEPSKPGVSPPRHGGSLHPAMAGWLQGYPQAHLNCAPSSLPKAGHKGPRKSKATETPSCRK